MENKNKKSNNTNNFHYCRYNSTKIKQNGTSKSSKEVNNYKKNEHSNAKNDNSNKKLKSNNDLNNDNNINKGINYNISNNNNNNKINEMENHNIINSNSTHEQINKLRYENEELKKHINKKNGVILNLKDRCNEQKSMIEELMKKIDNIKKFIPESAFRKDKRREKEKDKLEEQLAIAAVEEQIIKELCPNNSNEQAMDKIFNGENNSKEAKIKDKIMIIPQIYYKKNEFDNFECFICYDEFKDNELLKQLQCKHIFHKECLSQWLMNNNNCPVCNQLC
jgi:hypothetical protein